MQNSSKSDRKQNPKLTVILSAYNAEKYIAQSLESILNQSFQNFEIIIADDGSKDKTRLLIDNYRSKENVIISHNEKNQGKVNTVNRLFKMAKGELITVHDADDFSHPERFQKQIDFLERENLAMCGTDFYNLDSSDNIISIVKTASDIDEIKKKYLHESQFHGPTMLFRKDIVEQVGGLYRFFRNKEDVDFAVRVVEKYPASNLNQVLYYYRNHPDSLSKSGYTFLKFEGMKLIQFLHEERMASASHRDCLMTNDIQKFNEYLEILEKPYKEDPALIHRKSAAHNLYFKFYKSAIKQSILSIFADPYRFENYGTLNYCIKRLILNTIK